MPFTPAATQGTSGAIGNAAAPPTGEAAPQAAPATAPPASGFQTFDLIPPLSLAPSDSSIRVIHDDMAEAFRCDRCVGLYALCREVADVR
jgi:hypothetical protein